jgi:multidrug efflux pump subunit AcrA (membrane-fusion protein)
MTKPNIFDGQEKRQMTDSEYEQWLTDADEAETQAEAQAAKVSAREALLTKLGITADEAQLLLGA